jgi:hypothetical protein
MLVIFEVYLVPGADPNGLLSAETKRETNAQIMTFAEATAVGLSGLKPDPTQKGELRLIAINRRDAPWIHRTLETNHDVAGFRMHEVDM